MIESPEAALRKAVDDLGGDKAVGTWLRPEMHPILAGQWLAHCLDPERREKFSAAQIVLIFAHAKARGRHDGFAEFARACGYVITSTIDEREQIADLARKAQAASRDAQQLTDEVFARMQAAGLKVEP